MTRYSSFLLAGTLALASACGDENPTGPGGAGTLTATVNTSPFSAQFPPTAILRDGDLYIDATQSAGSGYKSITISLTGVTQTGTYAIGLLSDAENYAVYGEAGAQLGDYRLWFTSHEVASGEVVITHLSSSQITGTFHFTAEPFVGGATGTKTVTNGAFSVNPLAG